jgi:hypothetical protein
MNSIEEPQWPQEVLSPFGGGMAQLHSELVEMPYKSGLYIVRRYFYRDEVTQENFISPEQWDHVLLQVQKAHIGIED